MIPPRGVIFDLFHTLTRVEPRRSPAGESSAPEPSAPTVDRAAWTHALLELSPWRLRGEERDPVAIMRRAAQQVDPAMATDVIEAETRRRMNGFRSALLDIPEENVTTLRSLRTAGFRLALLSNADALEAAGWPESPLAGLFDTVVFSCFVGCFKPEPEIYQICLRQIGLEAPDCWFVADGASNELAGARTVGITTVFMSGVVERLWPNVIAERLQAADYRIRTIPDLRPLLGIGAAE